MALPAVLPARLTLDPVASRFGRIDRPDAARVVPNPVDAPSHFRHLRMRPKEGGQFVGCS
jgi:hypothetical protein